VIHVGSRGVEQHPIFRDDVDRRMFLRLLADVVTQQRWRCVTYCLMTNHYHLVIRLEEPNLSVGMQRLNGEYARSFNERHGRTGHLFEKRFWSEVILRETQLLNLARYIALNPVRASLCRAPRDWLWSAHRTLLGECSPGFVDVEAILCHFDADPERAVRGYADYVDRDVDDADPTEKPA
jgi:REP element-mobilizing transposase RayT